MRLFTRNYKKIFSHISVSYGEAHMRDTQNKALQIFEKKYAKNTAPAKPLFIRMRFALPLAAVILVVISFSIVTLLSPFGHQFARKGNMLEQEKFAVMNGDNSESDKKSLITEKNLDNKKTNIRSKTKEKTTKKTVNRDDKLLIMLSKSDLEGKTKYKESDSEEVLKSEDKSYTPRSKKSYFTNGKTDRENQKGKTVIVDEEESDAPIENQLDLSDYIRTKEYNTITFLPKPVSLSVEPAPDNLPQIINFFVQEGGESFNVYNIQLKDYSKNFASENFVIVEFIPKQAVHNIKITVKFNNSVEYFKIAGTNKNEQSKKRAGLKEKINRAFKKGDLVALLVKILPAELSNQIGIVEVKYSAAHDEKEMILSSRINAPSDFTPHSPSTTKKIILSYIIYQYNRGNLYKQDLIDFYSKYFTQKDIDNFPPFVVQYINGEMNGK